MPREQVNFSLRFSPRPIYTGRYELLSSAVMVYKEGKKYYCYVAFSDHLIKKVGKLLPEGLSKDNAAYLFVNIMPRIFNVYARYHSGTHEVLLWTGETHAMPGWLKNIHEVKS